MNLIRICLLYLFMVSQSYGQNYIEYQKIFNRVDEDILSQDFQSAVGRLDSVYTGYRFIYAKHCIKALQICIVANDSIHVNTWLQKCFIHGIPLWYICTNGITKKVLAYSTTQHTLKKFDSLNNLYKNSIDHSLKRKIDSLLVADQRFTQKVNNGFVLFIPVYWLQWHINNQRQYRVLKMIIETNGYPEEKAIGLPILEDSAGFAKHLVFYGPAEIRNGHVQIMLQHCYSTWYNVDFDFKNTLLKNVTNGNLPPYQFAIISDFMLMGKRKYLKEKYHLNSNKYEQDYEGIINKNRNSIGLTTVAQGKRNTYLEREKRKNKIANLEIMLEY